jgi:hypothetical protein
VTSVEFFVYVSPCYCFLFDGFPFGVQLRGLWAPGPLGPALNRFCCADCYHSDPDCLLVSSFQTLPFSLPAPPSLLNEFQYAHEIPSSAHSANKLLQGNLSFDQRYTTNLQTLSTNDVDPDGVIQGLLYVPDIDPADPCFNQTQAMLPKSVTRQANLPDTDFNIIGLAPWVSANCTKSFLTSAHFDPIRAFIFYIPDKGTDQPPPISSPVWDMNDGGAWKSSSPFPVYAVPGLIGSQMMTRLSLYSGNLTTVPHGHELTSEYQVDPRDYVRVYTEIDVNAQSSIPALWVFLLIVAGGLLFVLCSTSLLMHYIQRRRRARLRRRIERGQVDLEALGIKRLTVPSSVIEKMPLFVYTCKEDETAREVITLSHDRLSSSQEIETKGSSQASDINSRPVNPSEAGSGSLDKEESRKSSIAAQEYVQHAQPTCPICLEDFVSGSTTIRELPCGHIFHPECIDSFLSNNSSLCPMCKKTTLPLGYCPERITNAMVRRERAIRRLRSRVTVNEDGHDVEGGRSGRFDNVRSLGRRIFGGNDIRNPADELRRLGPNYEMRLPPPPRVGPTWLELHQGLSRQQIAQQREQGILGNPVEVEDTDFVEEQRQPRCKISSSPPAGAFTKKS